MLEKITIKHGKWLLAIQLLIVIGAALYVVFGASTAHAQTTISCQVENKYRPDKKMPVRETITLAITQQGAQFIVKETNSTWTAENVAHNWINGSTNNIMLMWGGSPVIKNNSVGLYGPNQSVIDYVTIGNTRIITSSKPITGYQVRLDTGDGTFIQQDLQTGQIHRTGQCEVAVFQRWNAQDKAQRAFTKEVNEIPNMRNYTYYKGECEYLRLYPNNTGLFGSDRYAEERKRPQYFCDQKAAIDAQVEALRAKYSIPATN